jgi:hypothetical protein
MYFAFWFFMKMLSSPLFILEKNSQKIKETQKTSDPSPKFCSTKLAQRYTHAITHSLYFFSRNTVSHNFISKFLFLYITCQFFVSFHFFGYQTHKNEHNTKKHSETLHNTTKELIFRAMGPEVQNLTSNARNFNRKNNSICILTFLTNAL